MFAMQKIIPGFTVSNPVDRKKGNVTDMAKKNTYDAGSISVLEGLEAVRKRPGMYIGSVSRKGLNHLIYEIVDNAVDEHLAGYCSLIHVILEKDGSCTVTDNGRGIPVDMHEKGVSAERLVFTTLHAGGKFDNSAYKTSGGLHGVGSSVVNALSTYLDIKISRDGYVHHDHYERGIPTIELEEGLLPKLGKTRQTGTSINFLPDPEIFEKRGENIWVAKNATVAQTACLNGPLIIDENAEIRHCAFIRGNAIVGKGAVVGNSTELKNVVLFNGVQVPHYNYVGDSVLGHKSHMGAGSITSNVKSDKTLVVVKDAGEQIETGLKKFGAMLGDFVEVGCGSVLNPGTVIGSHTNVYPLSSVRGVVPAHSIYKKQGEIAQKH